MTETRDPRLWAPLELPTGRRVPTNREDTEVRVFTVEVINETFALASPEVKTLAGVTPDQKQRLRRSGRY